ncbi:hypothetical protein EG832_20390 [bacterium]|nr:hypothetical protein [bacterium]
MSYFIILFQDGSLKIFKTKQDKARLPEGARLFVCSSNVTMQDLWGWASNGFKGLNTIEEVEK